MTISSRWAIQRIFDMIVKDVTTLKPYGKLTDLKTCNVNAEQTNVYSSGGAGNPYITAHSHSKRLTGTATAATFNDDILGLLNGTDVAIGATPVIPIEGEEHTVQSNVITLAYTPLGTAGSEITALFLLNADGSFGTEYTQAATPAAGKFSLSSKTITFATGELADDTAVVVYYNAQSGSSTRSVVSNVNEFSKIVRIELPSLIQDACSGEEKEAVLIIYKAKLSGKVTFDLASDGEPAVMDVSFEGLKASCASNKLWELIEYDADELA